MGFDRKGIRSVWGLAAGGPIIGAAGLVFGRAQFAPWWLGVGAAVSAVSFGVTWWALRRRYAALSGANVAAREPIGPGPAALRSRLVLAFFRHDPAGLNLDDRRPAEYGAEVDRLVTELPTLRSEAQVRQLIYGMLVSSFDTAPEPFDDSLYKLAAEVWMLWSSWSRVNPVTRGPRTEG
ncbi:MAG: hypothetical protein WD770_08955 [Actinomycetota bacterium]